MSAPTIAFEVSSGVISFHWSGPGSVRVLTQFRTQQEAIEAFERLQLEVAMILETLQLDLTSPAFKTEPPPPLPPPPTHFVSYSSSPSAPSTPSSSSSASTSSASPSFAPRHHIVDPAALAAVAADPRLTARQRPAHPAPGDSNTGKMPPGSALKLAESMVAAYAQAQGRLGTSPPESYSTPESTPPQPFPTSAATPEWTGADGKAHVGQKIPTHEEALVEAREFINRQRAAMGLPSVDMPTGKSPSAESSVYPSSPVILPPPPPVESAEAIQAELSKSS